MDYQVKWSGTSTNSSQIELMQSNLARVVISEDGADRFWGGATAFDADSGSAKEWQFTAMVKNVGGTLSFVGSVEVTDLRADSGTDGWSLTFEVDQTNKAFVPKATGESGRTISWNAYASAVGSELITVPVYVGAAGSASSLCEDWAAGDGEREKIYATERGVMAQWLSKAQEIFCERSECLRNVWTPTITSTGYVAIPSYFGREIPNMVKWDDHTRLIKIDYAKALNTIFSGVNYYSIWNGSFYVWSATAGTPTIPYVKKPTAITAASLATADMEIPTEYFHDIFYYLDSMFLRRKNDINNSIALYKMFIDAADAAKYDYGSKNDAMPMMRGTFF